MTWPNVELLKDVDEKSLNFVPGIDGVGAVKNNHYVHERLTSCEKQKDETESKEQQWRKEILLIEEMPPCYDQELFMLVIKAERNFKAHFEKQAQLSWKT